LSLEVEVGKSIDNDHRQANIDPGLGSPVNMKIDKPGIDKTSW
jgi:hypothetical protein